MNRRIFIQTATVGVTSLAALSLTRAFAADKTIRRMIIEADLVD